MEIEKMIDLYQRRKAERLANMLDFYYGNRMFLVTQRASIDQFGPCNDVEMVVKNNLTFMEKSLPNDFTDDLPYLEPWVGVGVYANAFGCEYVWSDIEAPNTNYRYHKIEEVKNIDYPDWRKSPIMRLALDCIDALKEKTKGQMFLLLTDTQSPFDTATLILDACELFAVCYLNEDIVTDFMDKITRLIIEFSRVQIEHIGEDILACPGHNLPSCPGFEGIAISDDNLAVSSPQINQKIALPFDQKIADEFSGLAIHSCGRWTQTMELLRDNPSIKSIDCALGKETDPAPNNPVKLKNVLKGSKIIAKVRVGNKIDEIEQLLDKFLDPAIKTVVEMDYDPKVAELNYKRARQKLESFYGSATK
jgi:hypothetical protein